MKIDPDMYYRPTAEELRPIGAVQTLARWRCERCGPAYVRSGNRILYKGSDILDWLDANRIDPGLNEK